MVTQASAWSAADRNAAVACDYLLPLDADAEIEIDPEHVEKGA
jgi:hypothetical protein